MISNLFDTELICHRTWNKIIRYWTCQMLNLSDTELLITSMEGHWSTLDRIIRLHPRSMCREWGEGTGWTIFVSNFTTGRAGRGLGSSWAGRGRGTRLAHWEGLAVIMSWEGREETGVELSRLQISPQSSLGGVGSHHGWQLSKDLNGEGGSDRFSIW
jgi:hypothetical protein